MTTEDSRTSTKARYAFRDVSIDEECLRTSDAPGVRSTFGKEPELGVDKGSRGDRVSELLATELGWS